MRILKQQNGMTMIGWLLLLGLMIGISLPIIKVIPIYIASSQINYALQSLNPELAKLQKTATPEEIKKMLLTDFNLEILSEMTADEITVKQVDNKHKIRIQHQFKGQIFSDVYIIFDKSVDIPIQQSQ
jgi:hypothetical protein